MASHGDPAVAFGPVPGQNGRFSWANGSRLYYGNITFPFGKPSVQVRRRDHRLAHDDVEAAAAGDQSVWKEPGRRRTEGWIELLQRQGRPHADTRASSPHFGNVYVCWSGFRSRGGLPEPMTVARSTDGGGTWGVPVTLTPARNSVGFNGRQGCQVGTTARGTSTSVGRTRSRRNSTQQSVQVVSVSHDGGQSFSRAQVIAPVTDVGALDPLSGNLTFDGVAGSRTDSIRSSTSRTARDRPGRHRRASS